LERGCSSGVEHNLAKVGVEGSNPFARSKSLNGLVEQGGARQGRLSAECPRNVFGGRSGDALSPQTSEAPGKARSGDQASSLSRVRQRSAAPAAHRDYQERSQRPAHPSNGLVAQLNGAWRVVDDPLQWRLQRRKGNPRNKNTGWQDRSFCTTREGLIRCVREYCGNVEPGALATLAALPEHHGIPNLDVCGTDQARANKQPEPLVPQALEQFEARA
jgi:hypothetical protein